MTVTPIPTTPEAPATTAGASARPGRIPSGCAWWIDKVQDRLGFVLSEQARCECGWAGPEYPGALKAKAARERSARAQLDAIGHIRGQVIR